MRSARLEELAIRLTDDEREEALAIANDIVRIMMQAGTSINMAEFAFEAVLESLRSIKWKDEEREQNSP